MEESKAKRLIVASTVGAVLLLIFLLVIMVYQLVAIKAEAAREKELRQTIAQYEALVEEGEITLEQRQMERWLIARARELGYTNIGDMILGMGK